MLVLPAFFCRRRRRIDIGATTHTAAAVRARRSLTGDPLMSSRRLSGSTAPPTAYKQHLARQQQPPPPPLGLTRVGRTRRKLRPGHSLARITQLLLLLLSTDSNLLLFPLPLSLLSCVSLAVLHRPPLSAARRLARAHALASCVCELFATHAAAAEQTGSANGRRRCISFAKIGRRERRQLAEHPQHN